MIGVCLRNLIERNQESLRNIMVVVAFFWINLLGIAKPLILSDALGVT